MKCHCEILIISVTTLLLNANVTAGNTYQNKSGPFPSPTDFDRFKGLPILSTEGPEVEEVILVNDEELYTGWDRKDCVIKISELAKTKVEYCVENLGLFRVHISLKKRNKKFAWKKSTDGSNCVSVWIVNYVHDRNARTVTTDDKLFLGYANLEGRPSDAAKGETICSFEKMSSNTCKSDIPRLRNGRNVEINIEGTTTYPDDCVFSFHPFKSFKGRICLKKWAKRYTFFVAAQTKLNSFYGIAKPCFAFFRDPVVDSFDWGFNITIMDACHEEFNFNCAVNLTFESFRSELNRMGAVASRMFTTVGGAILTILVLLICLGVIAFLNVCWAKAHVKVEPELTFRESFNFPMEPTFLK